MGTPNEESEPHRKKVSIERYDQSMLRFLKTTVIGGILFLVPAIILFAIVGKALQITNKLAMPIAGRLGVDQILGIAVAELLAIGILVLVCFLAGLAAKTLRAREMVKSLETNLLEKIPLYELLKAKTHIALSFEGTQEVTPVTVRFDDSWQIAFKIERLEDGRVVIFIPGAPDPWAGSVAVVAGDRVVPLDMTVKSAITLIKRLGRGSVDVLRNPIGPGNTPCMGFDDQIF